MHETGLACATVSRWMRKVETCALWHCVVVDDKDGSVKHGMMFHVEDRSRATLSPVIDSLMPERGHLTITSDAWRAYWDVGVEMQVDHRGGQPQGVRE